MARTSANGRINGPYKHGRKWRVLLVGPTGEKYEVFDSEAEAHAYVIEQRHRIEHRTIGEAVTEYLETMTRGGARKGSVTTSRYRLIAMLRLMDGDRLLRSLTPTVADRLYRVRSREVRTETHRGELAVASRFAAWCVTQGWLSEDPFAGVQPVGERARGKLQLRVDEARQFLRVVLAEDSIPATAVALALLLGLRASEVTERVARDLDDGGRLLWIANTATASVKTRAGLRQLEVPEVLRARLQSLVVGCSPEARIFGGLTRHALYHHVKRLCALAGVPLVSPHGLRGLHATMAVSVGVSVEAVARALGHAGTGVTRGHYLQPGAEQSARGREIGELLTRAEHPIEQPETKQPELETKTEKSFPIEQPEVLN